MRPDSRLYIGLMAIAVSSFFLVQASAQVPPVKMTACFTKSGDSKSWNFGDQPLKPCAGNESQATFVLQAGLDAQAAAGGAAVAAEAAARIAADNTLQTNINNETSARMAADSSETTARQAADTTLQTNINNEATARNNGDTALANQITTNTADIAAIQTEIGDQANNYANSRIDQAAGAAVHNLAPVIFWTDEGGHEDPSNFYRGGTYNLDTGDFKMYFDTNHGLDKSGGYWFCTIGDQVAQGDLLVALQTKMDDFAAVQLKGFHDSSRFAFKLKTVPGMHSPFKRVLVHPHTGGPYIDITANINNTDSDPNNDLTAWIYGQRSAHPDGVGLTGTVSVAVSHAELEARCGCTLDPAEQNGVLVDLNFTWTNVLQFEDGTNRGTHPNAAILIPQS